MSDPTLSATARSYQQRESLTSCGAGARSAETTFSYPRTVSQILLDDRFVGTFGVVAAGDDSAIVKVAVAAARAGFGVVPMQYNSSTPACGLTIRESKKPHDCYHVYTEDTKVRPAFQRLTKDEARVGLAIDLGISNIGVIDNVDWWEGPEISPTLVMPDDKVLYVFDLSDADQANPVDTKDIIPESMITSGTLLVPPSVFDDKPVVLVGQMNKLSDNVRTETQEEETVAATETEVPDTLWNNDTQDVAVLTERVEALEIALRESAGTIEALTEKFGKLQEALVVALTTIKELKNRE